MITGTVAAAVTYQGTVKALMRKNHYGFINGDDGVERFFHKSGLVDSSLWDRLEEGVTRVQFILRDAPRGIRAEELKVVTRRQDL